MSHVPSSSSGHGHQAALSGSGSDAVHRERTSQLPVQQILLMEVWPRADMHGSEGHYSGIDIEWQY